MRPRSRRHVVRAPLLPLRTASSLVAAAVGLGLYTLLVLRACGLAQPAVSPVRLDGAPPARDGSLPAGAEPPPPPGDAPGGCGGGYLSVGLFWGLNNQIFTLLHALQAREPVCVVFAWLRAATYRHSGAATGL
jgi:hypothetical protein